MNYIALHITHCHCSTHSWFQYSKNNDMILINIKFYPFLIPMLFSFSSRQSHPHLILHYFPLIPISSPSNPHFIPILSLSHPWISPISSISHPHLIPVLYQTNSKIQGLHIQIQVKRICFPHMFRNINWYTYLDTIKKICFCLSAKDQLVAMFLLRLIWYQFLSMNNKQSFYYATEMMINWKIF